MAHFSAAHLFGRAYRGACYAHASADASHLNLDPPLDVASSIARLRHLVVTPLMVFSHVSCFGPCHPHPSILSPHLMLGRLFVHCILRYYRCPNRQTTSHKIMPADFTEGLSGTVEPLDVVAKNITRSCRDLRSDISSDRVFHALVHRQTI